MYMLLMVMCMTFFGVAVATLAFATATRPEVPAEKAQPELPVVKPAPARFFADRTPQPIPVPPQVPIEVLLQQIENHVRLEQAAAETFVAFPTHASLRGKTTSPFVN